MWPPNYEKIGHSSANKLIFKKIQNKIQVSKNNIQNV